MSRKFNVGDRVRIIKTVLREAEYLIGTVTVVIGYDANDNTYELDIPAGPGWLPNVWAVPQNIVPYYDGDEKVSWSSCVWQPKNIEVRT